MTTKDKAREWFKNNHTTEPDERTINMLTNFYEYCIEEEKINEIDPVEEIIGSPGKPLIQPVCCDNPDLHFRLVNQSSGGRLGVTHKQCYCKSCGKTKWF